MKKIIAVALCIFAAGSISAQNKATTSGSAVAGKKTGVKKSGPCVGGTILDARKHGITDVQAFIYAKDSTIIASGYTDEKGKYETNAVMSGTYKVKFVYPSAKAITVDGVIIKNGVTPINITAAEPAADTSLPFTDFVPQVVDKKKAK